MHLNSLMRDLSQEPTVHRANQIEHLFYLSTIAQTLDFVKAGFGELQNRYSQRRLGLCDLGEDIPCPQV
jgi:hypothetical protein